MPVLAILFQEDTITEYEGVIQPKKEWSLNLAQHVQVPFILVSVFILHN